MNKFFLLVLTSLMLQCSTFQTQNIIDTGGTHPGSVEFRKLRLKNDMINFKRFVSSGRSLRVYDWTLLFDVYTPLLLVNPFYAAVTGETVLGNFRREQMGMKNRYIATAMLELTKKPSGAQRIITAAVRPMFIFLAPFDYLVPEKISLASLEAQDRVLYDFDKDNFIKTFVKAGKRNKTVYVDGVYTADGIMDAFVPDEFMVILEEAEKELDDLNLPESEISDLRAAGYIK